MDLLVLLDPFDVERESNRKGRIPYRTGQDLKLYPSSVRLDKLKVFSYARSLDQILLSAFFVFPSNNNFFTLIHCKCIFY